ncbi:hypothetical protein UFOVP1015_42 [uncultured Caudovirales phage]|uniref:Uncharacterized protein n=1 Tax=uncultured Caudovirales phage TaxID=2100421 RepID=A0A6J7XMR3_9CAUD|nr:hypothetical protein UFOVP1015_42 [uncultured Caudovirales phage]CAB5229268.1 hypothetical protein UFOVP1551_23 [uncultured Caudovirales phage]
MSGFFIYICRMRAIKYYLKKFRFWLLKKLFTNDEKYLITQAIETRQDVLRSLIGEKWADNSDMKNDLYELCYINTIFKTNLTK